VKKPNDELSHIIGLSTKDQKQQERITAHNKKTPIISIKDINPHFLYISIKNKLTIKISLNDRVFVSAISTLESAGLGTVRRILHPLTNESYNLHEHFIDLTYLVELDSKHTTHKVVQRNIAKMKDQTLQFPKEPIHYLRCEIFDIYQCSQY